MLHKNLTPFQFGAKVTSRTPPQAEMTVFVRACYRLTPGQPLEAIADQLEQGQLSGDQWHEDDENLTGELKRISDFAEYLPTAEVLLTGSCHAPGGQPTVQVPVRFRVGDWEKQLVVTGPRVWKGAAVGYSPGEPAAFTSMPLTWANAFGGEGFADNPVGKGAGTLEMPCVEYPGGQVSSPNDRPAPASFTGISPHWAHRVSKRGKNYGKEWKRIRAPFYSDDFDWSFFYAAPIDQRLPGYLRGDEELELQNLHAEAPLIRVSLPGTRVRVFWMNDEGEITETEMVADQLRVAPDENRVYLMWRGLTPVQDIDLEDVKYVLIASEEAGESRDDGWYHDQLRAFADDPIGLKEKLPPGFEEAAEALDEAEDQGRLADVAGVAPDGKGNPVSDLLEQRFGAIGAAQQQQAATMINNHASAWSSAPPPTAKSFNQYLADGLASAGKSTPPVPHMVMSNALSKLATARMQLARLENTGDAVAKIDRVFDDPNVNKALGPLAGKRDFRAEAAQAEAAGVDPDAPPPDPLASPPPAEGLRDLVGADLSNRDLRGQSFANCDLTGANLGDSDISGCDFRNSVLAGASLYRAAAEKTDFTGCNFDGAILDRIKAAGAIFRDCNLANAGFYRAKMPGVVLDGATCHFTRFQKADLTGCSAVGMTTNLTMFDNAKLDGANFTRAHLVKAGFHGVSAVGANFDGADISELQAGYETDLREARITNAKADRAVFKDASLVEAYIADTSWKRAIFINTNAVGAQFIACDLSTAMMRKAGLEKVQFVRCKLFRAELPLACCVDTAFVDCNLYGAVMFDTLLANCSFTNTSTAHVMSRESE